jgi:hypothetical protein
MQAPAHLVFSALLLVSAPLVPPPDENSICGKVESGQLSLPSYRFAVEDENGIHAANLRAGGALEIVEGVWRGRWFSGQWEDLHHDIAIRVVYDPEQAQYVSQELPHVRIERRKKGLAPFKTNCWDRVTRLTFTFDRPGPGDAQAVHGRGSFVFNVPNTTVNEIGLPDPALVIKIVVRARARQTGELLSPRLVWSETGRDPYDAFNVNA